MPSWSFQGLHPWKFLPTHPYAARLRHVHIPHLPPHYPPFWVAERVSDAFERKLRDARRYADPFSKEWATDDGFRRYASAKRSRARGPDLPPPAVVSFAPSPGHASLPDPRDVPDRRLKVHTSDMSIRLTFPRLPARLDPHRKQARAEAGADPYDHTYGTSAVSKLQNNMPLRHGPTHLVLWPVLDLEALRQEMPDSAPQSHQEYMRLLGRTTIAVLRREFGITATQCERGRDLHVCSASPHKRSIARIWPRVDEDGVTTQGLTLNVGGATDATDGIGGLICAEDSTSSFTTTSIGTELASAVPRMVGRGDWVNLGSFATGPPGSQHAPTWYAKNAVAAETGMMHPTALNAGINCTPLGMDNYAIAVAWTHEFARQLRMPRVEHLGPRGTMYRLDWTGIDLWGQEDTSTLPSRPRVVMLGSADPIGGRQARYETGAKRWDHGSGFTSAKTLGLRPQRAPDWEATVEELTTNLNRLDGREESERRERLALRDDSSPAPATRPFQGSDRSGFGPGLSEESERRERPDSRDDSLPAPTTRPLQGSTRDSAQD